MEKLRVQLRDISTVAASGSVLINLPIGPRYHSVIIQHAYAAGTNTAAGAATNLNQIRVKLNGRSQRTVTGTQLRDLMLLNGTGFDIDATLTPNTAPGTAFTIPFAEPWRKDARDQDALAWATRWAKTNANGATAYELFQIEIDLGAAATPAIVAWAVIDGFVPDTQPGIVKWIRQSYGASGTSFDISQFDRRDFYTQISIYPDSGASNVISKATFRRDGVILHEMTNTANRALLLGSQMTPAASGRTASIYDLVFDHDDLLGSAVNMNGVRDCQLTIEAAAAMSGTSTLIIQRLGSPE